jgi:hypothetical protein
LRVNFFKYFFAPKLGLTEGQKIIGFVVGVGDVVEHL